MFKQIGFRPCGQTSTWVYKLRFGQGGPAEKNGRQPLLLGIALRTCEKSQ